MWTIIPAEQHLTYSTEILKILATMAVGHNVEGDLSNLKLQLFDETEKATCCCFGGEAVP